MSDAFRRNNKILGKHLNEQEALLDSIRRGGNLGCSQANHGAGLRLVAADAERLHVLLHVEPAEEQSQAVVDSEEGGGVIGDAASTEGPPLLVDCTTEPLGSTVTRRQALPAPRGCPTICGGAVLTR